MRLPIKVGERFYNLRLVTSFAHLLKDLLAPHPPKVALQKEKKAWLREPKVTKVTGPMRPVTGNRKVARFSGNYLPFVCKNAERRPPILLPALTIATYRYRWKVACFSSPRRLPAHVIREEKAASGSSLSRATGRR
ncbi:hypothetical protein VNO78_31180 [Psophocarpus tetragonolobus]|uniref:Uncharacterized protein n=1 Tax=Psophocarpus tetragonolobus TaxID=3891 RepID=A0AAN9RXY9_PSOTE